MEVESVDVVVSRQPRSSAPPPSLQSSLPSHTHSSGIHSPPGLHSKSLEPKPLASQGDIPIVLCVLFVWEVLDVDVVVDAEDEFSSDLENDVVENDVGGVFDNVGVEGEVSPGHTSAASSVPPGQSV